MKSNYKRLGDYIQELKVRNTAQKAEKLLGINIDKFFMPSVANVIGTDLSVYKLVKKYQFACNRMHVGRDDRLPIAMSKLDDEFMVSPAYDVFEISSTEILDPEYLMMWFSRREFDRNACFYTDADVRGGLSWSAFCDMQLPIPHIDKQREIVKEYNIIQNRIILNQQLIKKLEETAQTIYKQWFVDGANESWEEKLIGDLCTLITDGKHGDCQNELDSGCYFVSVKDLINGDIFYDNVRQITKKDFEETHKRTDLKPGDILLTSSGTIGRMIIVKEDPKTNRTTLQKSVAILKPIAEIAPSYYLFSLLNSEMKNIIELAGGSTIANLLLGDLKRYKTRYPGRHLIIKYEKLITPIFKNIELKNRENQKLTQLKELLLSKLATAES